MPGQVIPLTDLGKAGVIMDTPSVSLPPNVFSDVLNVRFHNNSVRKMEGEKNLNIEASNGKELVYIAWWPHPSLAPDDGYYVIISEENNTYDVSVVQASSSSGTAVHTYDWPGTFTTTPRWQHTLFGGGNVIILNNGLDTPRYIIDPNQDPLRLPGWDSYLVEETVTSIIWDGFTISDEGIDLGQRVDLTNLDEPITISDDDALTVENVEYKVITAGDLTQAEWFALTGEDKVFIAGETFFPELTHLEPASGDAATVARVGTQRIVVTIVHANTDFPAVTYEIDEIPVAAGGPTVAFNDETGTHSVTPGVLVVDPNDDTQVMTQGVQAGDTVTVAIANIPAIEVTAGVVKTFGNLLVAGNLMETSRTTGNAVREMPGVIRTSDVAVSSSIPANWNPFRVGANTADEFTLTSTGIVQDMAELQGIMYVYTNNSIHSIQATGNPNLPYNVRPVTNGYGAQTIGAVQEFDGKHVVVGSNDIYIFAGHPGSIQSISDSRVRDYLFDNLNTTHYDNLHMILNRRYDELWINFPNSEANNAMCNETLIWNYRDNTWTRRIISPFYNSVIAPSRIDNGGGVNPNILVPVMVGSSAIFQADEKDSYTVYNDADESYRAYIERKRLAITPEFDTENLASMALLASGSTTLDISVRGSSTPADEDDLPDDNFQPFAFNMSEDYKTDIRVHGRFLNYRIGTANTNVAGWELSGLQFEIGKGGQR